MAAPEDRRLIHNKGIIGWDAENEDWVRISVDSNGVLNVNATLGDISIDGANGAILDGADANLKATVFDLTNANPLAVQTVDANGTSVHQTGPAEWSQKIAAGIKVRS